MSRRLVLAALARYRQLLRATKAENRILRARLEACERDRLSRPAQGDQ